MIIKKFDIAETPFSLGWNHCLSNYQPILKAFGPMHYPEYHPDYEKYKAGWNLCRELITNETLH